MKILVVGGTGTIGLPAVRALTAAGHDVRATARGPQKARIVRAAGAEPIDVDIYDVGALRGAMRGCDAVVRLTTKIADSMTAMRSRASWDETNRLRSVGAQRIVDAAIAEDVGTYVQESFYAAYADAGERIVDETAPSDDRGLSTMHAILVGEEQAARFAAAGRRSISLRFAACYSADSPSTREIVQMANKRMLPIVGTGGFFFPTLHISDAATAVAEALHAPSGTYNVCDDRPLRWREFVHAVADAAGGPTPMHLPAFLGPIAIGYPWRWMSRSIRLSNELFKSQTAWKPQFPDPIDGWRRVSAQAVSAPA